jgi:hypothetical protein
MTIKTTIKTLESIDRFDLEQDIMACWNVVDDLDVFLSRYMDGPEMSDDDVANVILGIKSLYQLKFQKCFDTFEQVLKNGGFTTKEQAIMNKVNVLESEIEVLKSRLQDHDTGHLHTAISILQERVKEIRPW